MNDPHAIRVLLRSAEGKYLAGPGLQGELTEDRARAAVFDYLRDRVAERLEMMQGVHGTTWRPVLVDPREVYEVCDRCGQRVMSFKAFFDGRQAISACVGGIHQELGRPLPLGGDWAGAERERGGSNQGAGGIAADAAA
jgi:hypothetical protein